MDTNVTSPTLPPPGNDSFLERLQSRDLLVALVVLTNIIALGANIIVITAIVFVEKLRKSHSSVFIFSLCILDLIASGTVIPKSAAIVLAGRWTWGEEFCVANGLFNAFLTFAVILTVCAVDLEKYYCIKYPMHHAGHMTITVAIGSIVVCWVIALVFAAIPIAFWDGYTYRPKSLQCTYLWDRKRQSVIFGIFITFVFLLLPLIMMLHINLTMYKIAKRAMCQVEPVSSSQPHVTKAQVRLSIIVTGAHGETSREISQSPELSTSITTSTAISRTGSAVVTDLNLTSDRASINSSSHFSLHTQAIKKIQSLQKLPAKSRNTSPKRTATNRGQRSIAQIRSETNYKALKSLVIPFVYFLVVWGSFFVLHLTWVSGILPRNATIETACTMLVYVSYSLNPFVYGFMNKTFRDESLSLLQDKLCRQRDDEAPPSPLPPSCENFLEFLERTSYSERGQQMGGPDRRAESLPGHTSFPDTLTPVVIQ